LLTAAALVMAAVSDDHTVLVVPDYRSLIPEPR